jgi:hypothetical protein
MLKKLSADEMKISLLGSNCDWFSAISVYVVKGATSSILFCICNNRNPFCFVLYDLLTSFTFSCKASRYSFSRLKYRYDLYTRFVLLGAPVGPAHVSSFQNRFIVI